LSVDANHDSGEDAFLRCRLALSAAGHHRADRHNLADDVAVGYGWHEVKTGSNPPPHNRRLALDMNSGPVCEKLAGATCPISSDANGPHRKMPAACICATSDQAAALISPSSCIAFCTA